MKILALTRYFPPDIGTASHLFFELCENLVNLGHQVSAVTSMPRYNLTVIPPKYRRRLFLHEQMAGMEVYRIAGFAIPNEEMRRKAEQILVAPFFYFAGLMASRPDLIIVYSPPLTLGVTAHLLGWKWQVPFIINVQDLYPQCLADYGYPDYMISFFARMADFVYARAQFITVHSGGNRAIIMRDSPVEYDKVRIMDNWVDTDLISPTSKVNEFSRQYDLHNKFVVSFAGSIGVPQGMEVMVDAACELREQSDIIFLIVGDGIEKKKLVSRAEELGLDKIFFLPMQPRETYPSILASSDVSLVTLAPGITTPVVPSKILSIMAAGRPVLASLPLQGDAPKLIHEAQCGLCVEPGNPTALAEAILNLYHHPELCMTYGANGRRYAEEHFSRTKCVAKYEGLFQEAINRHRLATTVGGSRRGDLRDRDQLAHH
jgi:colanic acid biosynthesis glycosyl transferase WcaI